MLIKKTVAGLIGVSMIIALVVLFKYPRPATSGSQQVGEPSTDIRIMVVEAGPLTEWIELPAEAEPFMSNEVSAEVDGRIDWIGPREGESIAEPGTPILRIEQQLFRAQLEEAEAAYELSAKKCRRAEELHAEGIFSDEQLDQCRAQVATDAARLDIARIQFEKATVSAPIAGVFNKSYFEVGEYVNKGDRIAEVVVIDPVKILTKVPERDISFLATGKKVRVVFSFLDESGFEGEISYKSVVGDPTTHTYDVEIIVPNPSLKILPSMIGVAMIVRREIPGAVMVPLASVLPRSDFSAVFVEEGGRAVERIVELGIFEGSQIQIKNGLKPGERLIVEGHRRLSDGEAVKIAAMVEAD